MRNIFDQYYQAENCATHALMTSLNEDRALLGEFLLKLVGVAAPNPSGLHLLVQQRPGEPAPAEANSDRLGIPDAWIYDEKGFCLIVETKLTAALTDIQMASHRRTALRRGFERPELVAIVTRTTPALSHYRQIEWRHIYGWLRSRALASDWAAKTAQYLEILESRLVSEEVLIAGSITMFDGIPFSDDHPYSYLEAKRLLGLMMNDLRVKPALQEVGVDPAAPGRTAITGKGGRSVWDFLPISISEAADFTKSPHLTLGILDDCLEAMVTLPNAIDTSIRRRIVALGTDGFGEIMRLVLQGMEELLSASPGAAPWGKVVQRRYPSQRSIPFVDATIEFDLRTTLYSSTGPKYQPIWLDAAYRGYADPHGPNIQLQIGTRFAYRQCAELKTSQALDLVAGAWLALAPLLHVARGT